MRRHTIVGYAFGIALCLAPARTYEATNPANLSVEEVIMLHDKNMEHDKQLREKIPEFIEALESGPGKDEHINQYHSRGDPRSLAVPAIIYFRSDDPDQCLQRYTAARIDDI